MARTAVVAGTATAVSGRVQRRQAERFAGRDASIYAQQQQAYAQQQQQYAPPASPPPAAAAAGSDTDDMMSQLQRLGDLKAQGILTEEEFAAQKARILAG
jgi:hypothetical protein